MAKPARSTSSPPSEREQHAHELLTRLTQAGPRTRTAAWLRSSTIVGLGLAHRQTAGERLPGDRALKVYVRRKLPKAKLKHPVPKRIRVRGVDVETDVDEVGDFSFDALSNRYRPARPGCSIGRKDGPFGTFGALVRRRSDPQLYLLSCAHVLAPLGLGQRGDSILQPAAPDGGSSTDPIARLEDWTRLRRSGKYPNRSDAAIARVLDASRVRAKLMQLGLVPDEIGDVQEDDEIRKVGRTTGLTTGIVLDTNFSVRPTLDTAAGPKRIGFRGQVLCSRYSAEGDSGALVLRGDTAVGLHLAASAGNSVFTPIRAVLEALELELA